MDEFKKELQKVTRTGMQDLLDFLEKSDFYTAPASTKFHLNIEGGLVEHSLNVLRNARLLKKELNLDLPDDHIIISSLLHDLCKIHYYKMGWEWDKEHKEETNQWRKRDIWKVEDQLPLGHGEKSVMLAQRYIKLHPCEMLAIRWHMAFSDPGVHFGYPSGMPFRETLDKHALAKVIALADQMSELFEVVHGSQTKDATGLE